MNKLLGISLITSQLLYANGFSLHGINVMDKNRWRKTHVGGNIVIMKRDRKAKTNYIEKEIELFNNICSK